MANGQLCLWEMLCSYGHGSCVNCACAQVFAGRIDSVIMKISNQINGMDSNQFGQPVYYKIKSN